MLADRRLALIPLARDRGLSKALQRAGQKNRRMRRDITLLTS